MVVKRALGFPGADALGAQGMRLAIPLHFYRGGFRNKP
jgi:hypothetical protein